MTTSDKKKKADYMRSYMRRYLAVPANRKKHMARVVRNNKVLLLKPEQKLKHKLRQHAYYLRNKDRISEYGRLRRLKKKKAGRKT